MKKRFTQLTLLLLLSFGANAQGLLSQLSTSDSTSNQSLFERITGIEKKTNRFNLTLNMQSTFNATFEDGSFKQAAFKMNQLRLEARGDINSWLSYRWRQRLNSGNAAHDLDNLPSSIDYAMITVRLTDKLSTMIGKQAAAYGGFEYDLDPIEIYQYSDMIDLMYFDFMTGITFSYMVTPSQELALQITNSHTASVQDIYGLLPNGLEESKAPLAYSVNWNGAFFNDAFKTRWSFSVLSQAKEKYNYFYALGNDLTLGKFNMFLDFYLSREDLDSRGILSEIYRKETHLPCAENARYISWVTKLNYRFLPKWNVFVKGMYETASLSKKTEQMEKGKYRTSYGYFGGIEFYPMTENLHFFATYMGRAYHFTGRAKALDCTNYNTSTLSLGLIYHIPLF